MTKIKSSTNDKSFFGLIEIAFNRYILFQGLSINCENCHLTFVGVPWFQRFIFIIFIAKGRGKINLWNQGIVGAICE
jgi:hypothetical protein